MIQNVNDFCRVLTFKTARPNTFVLPSISPVMKYVFLFILALSSSLLVAQKPEIVRNIHPGAVGSKPSDFVSLDGKLYFIANDSTHGRELWVTDGTEKGTELVVDLYNGNTSSGIAHSVAFKDKLYFSANANDGKGAELYSSDGTATGTKLVKDIYLKGGSNIQEIVVAGDYLFFSATNGGNVNNASVERGQEPWYSDGTTNGTKRYADVYAGYRGSNPYNFVSVGASAFWLGDIPSRGEELYRGTGGRSLSTIEVRPGLFDSDVRHMTQVGQRLYFTADGGTFGMELYYTGPSGGATLVKDIVPGPGGSFPSELTDVNGLCYFACNDGSGSGTELWKSDGTQNGTELAVDVLAGPTSSNPTRITHVGNWIFFMAKTPSKGVEAYATDGTEEGTFFLKDINPGLLGPTIGEMMVVKNKLYFSASTMADGKELWVSDGTTSGTKMVMDINSGSASSDPHNFHFHNGVLYFSANNGKDGIELWKLEDPCNVLIAEIVNTETNFCEGSTITLEANKVLDVNYQWFKNDTLLVGDTLDTLRTNAEAIYKVLITDAINGCKVESNPVTVSEGKTPVGILESSAKGSKVCPGSEVTFNAKGGDAYIFKYNGTKAQEGKAKSWTAADVKDGDKVELIALLKGCKSKNVEEIEISAHEVDPVSIKTSSAADAECEGTEVTFTADEGFKNYAFYVDEEEKQSGDNTVFKHSGSITYGVKVLAEDDNGCLAEADVKIVVHEIPEKPFILSDGDRLYIEKTYAQYEWFLEGASVQLSSSKSYDATASGNYTVEVTTRNGCSNISDAFYLQHSHIDDGQVERVSVFPNPFTHQLLVQTGANVARVKLFDATGNLLQSTSYLVLNTASLPTGVYWVEVESVEGVVARQKVLKQ